MFEFRMPSLGADMEAGTLVEWLVKPGDPVKRGDIVAVVETQKGAIEIEVFEPGHVEKILVDLHAKVPVGTPLALIRTDGEAGAPVAPIREAPAPSAAPAGRPIAPVTPPAAPVAPAIPRAEPMRAVPAAGGRVRASPVARRLAQERGIDLATITGTGPVGTIVYADVMRGPTAAPATPAAPIPPAKKERAIGLDLVQMRAAIAAAMARSKREIPHYYLEHQVDMMVAEHWLTHTNASREPENRLLMSVLTVKAVALVVQRFPAFNGFYREGRYEPAAGAHIGMAIAIRGGGLAAPALHDADRLTLDELMVRMRDLVQRMRSGRIRSSELTDATITVSSLGERGVEALYGIIYPPQVAIVGFGTIVTRPWVVDGAIGPRPIVTVTLSADHRVSDGHAGALFLAEIGKLLQEPEKL
jgi:pyruvate dehydrogenase E2 component (dihydrolipoamide acetyltransferase)